MAYSLETARTELKRSLPWLTRTVDREPMEGLYDGTNKVFHFQAVPVDSTTGVVIYDANGVALTGYTVNSYDYGTVTFSSGSVPASTVYGSYTTQYMSDAKLLDLCKAGFDEMESRYRRGYYTVVDADTYTYVSSTAAPTVTDPVIGSVTFSTSRAQVDLLLACTEYRLLKALLVETALGALAYREERIGGLSVDTTKRPQAFQALLDSAEAKIKAATEAAQDEVGGTSAWGQFVPGAKSDNYIDGYEWYPTSKQALGLEDVS